MSPSPPRQLRERSLRVGILGYGLDRPTTGISRYTIELASALQKHQPDIELVFLLPFEDDSPWFHLDTEIVRIRGSRLLPALMTIGPLQLSMVARRRGLDVIHDPTGIAPFMKRRRSFCIPKIATVHDAVPFVYPDTQTRLTQLLFHQYLPRTLRSADFVVTASESSRLDLVKYLDLGYERIAVIPLAVSDLFRPPTPHDLDRIRSKFNLAGPYLLAVGSLEPRKNLPQLFEAFRRLLDQGASHKLVVVGKDAWKSSGIFQSIHRLSLEDHVLVTGYVADEDLPGLYGGASCFIFPSLYEGFGLPPLEAMACGVPVVVSNSSSMPEVVGDAGILVDPRDVESLVSSIHRVIDHEELAASMRAKGLERASKYTWKHSANEHARLYRSLANGATDQEMRP